MRTPGATPAGSEWIGVEEVAAEMRYTKRQAWEFLRSIRVLAVNAKRMDLVRFTRAEFEEGRDRAKAPIPSRYSRVPTSAPTPPPAKTKINRLSVAERFRAAR